MKTLEYRLKEHLDESLLNFNESRIVGLFLQGSQNYGLQVDNSDVDTKLIITPTFQEIAMNQKPVSTTHVRVNNEHIDFKDIRLYIQTFKKQNLNFLEILFTSFKYLNTLYAEQWNRLIAHNEEIARMNPFKAVKSMKGIALEKYHAMEHNYPSKVEVLAQYGYDPKQLHHLVRVEEYLSRYIQGEPYGDCLIPRAENKEFIMDCKRGKFSLDEARELANKSIAQVIEMADTFCEKTPDHEDEQIVQLLNDVQYKIMEIAIKEEFQKEE